MSYICRCAVVGDHDVAKVSHSVSTYHPPMIGKRDFSSLCPTVDMPSGSCCCSYI